MDDLLDQASELSQGELQARVAALRQAPEIRAKRTASINQRRVMQVRHLLALIEEVDDDLRHDLTLVRARIDELLS